MKIPRLPEISVTFISWHAHTGFPPKKSCVRWNTENTVCRSSFYFYISSHKRSCFLLQCFLFLHDLINDLCHIMSNKLTFAYSRLKVGNPFIAPFQCESNTLHDLCRNISLGLTTLETCSLQRPHRGVWLAGLRLLSCLIPLRGGEEQPATGSARCSRWLLNNNHWSVLPPSTKLSSRAYCSGNVLFLF